MIEHAPVSGGAALVATVQALVVTSHAQADAASRYYVDAKAMLDTIEAHYRPILAAIEASKRDVRRMRDEDAAPWSQAASVASGLITDWRTRERQRVEMEQAAAAAAIEELVAADPDDAPARLSEALAEAPVVAAKLDGLVEVTRWTGQVHDLAAFIGAVARGAIPVQAIAVNQMWLDAEARRLHDSLGQVYPGTRAVSSVSLTRRAP